MTTAQQEYLYSVPGVSCAHCAAAISGEVEQIDGVAVVEVDVEARRVAGRGTDLDDAAVRTAIDRAGYEVAES